MQGTILALGRSAPLAALALLMVLLPGAAKAACTPAASTLADYRQSKVADVTQSCFQGGPNNPACAAEGCSVYVRSSKPFENQPPFHLTGTAGQDHRLAVPVKPCRGVEDIKSVSDCGGEGIWKFAWSGVGASDQLKYGVAVNPTYRRTQHQLHIHVSPVQRDLQAELAKVAAAKKTSWVPITCKGTSGGAFQAANCKVDLGGSPTGSGIIAKWESGNDPAAIKPFATVNDPKCGAILVSQPASNGGFVIVKANDRPAECLLYCTSDCQSKCTAGGYATC